MRFKELCPRNPTQVQSALKGRKWHNRTSDLDCISWSCCFDIIPGWRLHTWPPISLVLPLVLPDVADTSKRHAHTACMLALTCCCLSFCALG
eukprot:scaffold66111_cov14-Tisochrysis_lutea.AAC.1